jgi:prepilin-type N-terminal cleavage/methylation domain-containing protein
MTRIMKALGAKREQLAKKDEGFTLIELLVVVIIIGILAAIAIPVYIGVQNSAKDSAVKSDLGNAKTAVVAYFTQNNGAYPAIPQTKSDTSLANSGYPGPSLDYTAATDVPNYDGGTTPTTNSSDFCIEAKSPTGSDFHVSASGGVEDGTC